MRRFPLWKQHKPKFAERARRASAGAPCALDACSARAIVNNPGTIMYISPAISILPEFAVNYQESRQNLDTNGYTYWILTVK